MSLKKRVVELEAEMVDTDFNVDRVLGYCSQLALKNSVLENHVFELANTVADLNQEVYELTTPPDPFLSRVRRWINGDE